MRLGRTLERTLLAILIGVTLCTFIPGCPVQQTATTRPVTFTPAQQLILATETATFTLNGISDARDLGFISQADIDPYKPVIDGVLALRAQAEKDLRAGNVSNTDSAIKQTQVLLNRLEPLLLKIAAKKTAATHPTTQPSH